MAKIRLRKWVNMSKNAKARFKKTRKLIYCEERWTETPPDDDIPSNIFIEENGDGHYSFMKGDQPLKSFKIRGFNYRSFIDSMGRVRRPRYAKMQKTMHCRHCYIRGVQRAREKMEEELDDAYDEGYDECLEKYGLVETDEPEDDDDEESEEIPDDDTTVYPPGKEPDEAKELEPEGELEEIDEEDEDEDWPADDDEPDDDEDDDDDEEDDDEEDDDPMEE